MGATRQPTRSLKKPTVARCLVALAGLVAAGTSSAQGGEPAALTEREVVVRALERTSLAEVIAGEISIEEGRGRAQSAHPTPQLSYQREQTFGALGSTEHALSVSQAIDPGNRRGRAAKAGNTRARAARREGDAARLAIAVDARQRFYDLLYRQSRAVALESWIARIEEALAIVSRREQRGDAATYERRRLERERAVARGRLGVERAAAERASARLGALLELAPEAAGVRVAGTLLPEDDPAALPSLRSTARSRPDLLALDLRIEAASIDRAAASRWWVPELLLEGGWKGVDLGAQGRADGFLLGASLSVPLWNQLSGLERLADGEARAARGRRALLATELAGELGGARAEAVQLKAAAAEFRTQTTTASSELVRIASAGYQGGELGLLELLDAYRGAAEDLLTALEMEHAARRARIELDRLTGAGLP